MNPLKQLNKKDLIDKTIIDLVKEGELTISCVKLRRKKDER